MPALPSEVWRNIVETLLGRRHVSPLAFDGTPVPLPLPPVPSEMQLYVSTNLAPVSRFFYDLVSRFLWEHVSIQSNTQLERIARLFQSGPFIDRTIRLGSITTRINSTIRKDECDYRALGKLIRQTPNLRDFVMENHRDEFGRQTWTFSGDELSHTTEQLHDCPLIQALQFRDPCEPPSVRDLFLVSEGCTFLRQLQLANIAFPIDFAWSELRDVVFPALASLKIGNTRTAQTPDVSRRIGPFLAFLRDNPAVSPALREINLAEPLNIHHGTLGRLRPLISTALVRITAMSTPQFTQGELYPNLRTLLVDIQPNDIPLPNVPSDLASLDTLHFRQVLNSHYRPDYTSVQTRCIEAISLVLVQRPLSLTAVVVWVPTTPIRAPVRRLSKLAPALAEDHIDFIVRPNPTSEYGDEPDVLYIE